MTFVRDWIWNHKSTVVAALGALASGLASIATTVPEPYQSYLAYISVVCAALAGSNLNTDRLDNKNTMRAKTLADKVELEHKETARQLSAKVDHTAAETVNAIEVIHVAINSGLSERIAQILAAKDAELEARLEAKDVIAATKVAEAHAAGVIVGRALAESKGEQC